MFEITTLRALRDFVNAPDADKRIAAARALAGISKSPLAPETDWDEVNQECYRLFENASSRKPAYASAWLSHNPLSAVDDSLRVRNLYITLGLAAPNGGGLPNDHLARELDALLYLQKAIEKSERKEATESLAARQGEQDKREGLRAMEIWLEDHMRAWVPLFARRALAEPGLSDPVRSALEVLEKTFGPGPEDA